VSGVSRCPLQLVLGRFCKTIMNLNLTLLLIGGQLEVVLNKVFSKAIGDEIPSIFNQTTVIYQLIGFGTVTLYPFTASKTAKLALAGIVVGEIALTMMETS